jgi:hypothetical protein
MKYTLAALALVALAGTAGAQTPTRPPLSATVTPSGGAPTTPGATMLQRPEGSGGAMLPSTGAAGSPSPGVNLPSANAPGENPRAASAPNAVMAPNTPNTPIPPNAPGSNGAARKIQADGYKNVQGLTRGSDGKWHGTAMRGGTMVAVQVDARGVVSSE